MSGCYISLHIKVLLNKLEIIGYIREMNIHKIKIECVYKKNDPAQVKMFNQELHL